MLWSRGWWVLLVIVFGLIGSYIRAFHHVAPAPVLLSKEPDPVSWHPWEEGDMVRDIHMNLTRSFREGLQPSGQYLTALPLGGLTAQFQTMLADRPQINIIYMAKNTHRTPIIPPLTPNPHIRTFFGPRYSYYFNFSHFATQTGVKVLEWQDVKPWIPTSLDDLQGIDVEDYQKEGWKRYAEPFECGITVGLGLNPRRAMANEFQRQFLLNLVPIIERTDPRKGNLNQWHEVEKAIIGPSDEQFACITNAYYTKQLFPNSWKEIGIYLPFNTNFMAMVQHLLGRILPAETVDRVFAEPADFVAVHIRRGDIKQKCGYSRQAPLEEWRNSSCFIHLEDVQQAIQSVPWASKLPVLVATNSQFQEDMERFEEFGWHRIDHERMGTVDFAGPFTPAQVDAAVLLRAKLLIGMRHSSLSLLAGRRVEGWSNGTVILL